MLLLFLLPQQSRVALSAHHTLHRGIVHSLSGGQAGGQEAAQAEDDRSEPLTRDASILHRNHYVHPSRSLSLSSPKSSCRKRAAWLFWSKRIENPGRRCSRTHFLLGAARRSVPPSSFPRLFLLDVEPSARGGVLSSGSYTI